MDSITVHGWQALLVVESSDKTYGFILCKSLPSMEDLFIHGGSFHPWMEDIHGRNATSNKYTTLHGAPLVITLQTQKSQKPYIFKDNPPTTTTTDKNRICSCACQIARSYNSKLYKIRGFEVKTYSIARGKPRGGKPRHGCRRGRERGLRVGLQV